MFSCKPPCQASFRPLPLGLKFFCRQIYGNYVVLGGGIIQHPSHSCLSQASGWPDTFGSLGCATQRSQDLREISVSLFHSQEARSHGRFIPWQILCHTTTGGCFTNVVSILSSCLRLMLLYAVTEVSDVHGIFLSLMAVIFVLAGGPISQSWLLTGSPTFISLCLWKLAKFR